MLYIISSNNEIFGEFSLTEIIDLVKSGKAHLDDFLYDKEAQRVDYLGEFEQLQDLLPPRPKTYTNPGPYIIIKNDKLMGPYLLEEILDLLIAKKLSIYDYIDSLDGLGWSQIKELSIFKEYLPQLKNSTLERLNIDITQVDIVKHELIRRYNRSPYSARCRITYHDQEYLGNCVSISMGGCLIKINNAQLFQWQDTLFLRIIPDLINLPIVTQARVCNTQNDELSLEFINLDKNIKRKINDFIELYLEKKLINR